MATDFKKTADEFLKSQTGMKLTDKKDDLNKLMSSKDGQKVKQMLEKGGTDLMGAVKNGDMETLKNTLSDVLKTQEGARLASQLMKMMK